MSVSRGFKFKNKSIKWRRFMHSVTVSGTTGGVRLNIQTRGKGYKFK